MGDIMKALIEILIDNPLTVSLVVGGIICVTIALIGKISTAIEISGVRALLLGAFGICLILTAIGISWALANAENKGVAKVPASTDLGIPTNTPSKESFKAATASVVESEGDFIHSTCDWARDWELQSDGSYRWIGLPPGTSGCQNVGQSGELFDRLAKGEKITLVVEIGETPLGLDICSGSYKATEIIPGQTCASGNPDVWPKVSGTLVVVESTGFLVGTGK